jgi:copper homeostasis protein
VTMKESGIQPRRMVSQDSFGHVIRLQECLSSFASKLVTRQTVVGFGCSSQPLDSNVQVYASEQPHLPPLSSHIPINSTSYHSPSPSRLHIFCSIVCYHSHVIASGFCFPIRRRISTPPNLPRHRYQYQTKRNNHLSSSLPITQGSMHSPLLEIACFNADSALIAQEAGADRVELCKEQALGGTTPLLSTFKYLKDTLKIPVFVMIRPHGRDFIYSDQEYRDMERDIETFKHEGAQGFVFGILNEQGTVDKERCRGLLMKAEGLPCTFHRAFDEISEMAMLEQLESLVEVRFKAVLTSGGQRNAADGMGMLAKLVAAAKGRIDVIAGGGVRSSNLELLRAETNAPAFHSSAIVDLHGGEIASGDEIKLLERLLHG